MNLRDIQTINWKRSGIVFNKDGCWSPTDFGNHMAGEAGEACNFLNKMRRCVDRLWTILPGKDTEYHQHRLACGWELADNLICTTLVASSIGIDLQENVIAKYNATCHKYGYLDFMLPMPTLEKLLDSLPQNSKLIKGPNFWTCLNADQQWTHNAETALAAVQGAMRILQNQH